MLTGVVGLGIGPNAAFRWTMYLILSLWPVSIYLSARLFRINRWGSAAAAAMSPFLVSATGIGYEQHAYVWLGYGVWTQLWASFTLPLAWGFSWQAIREGRNYSAAVACISLTIALHFETGYLALLPLLLWPLVRGAPIMAGVRRAAVLVCGALLVSAWLIVPLIADRTWAATNEILHPSPLVEGYGAPRVLKWLLSGQFLDAGRIPVITILAAVGMALACAGCRKNANFRAVLVAFTGCLVLSFGRTTFGALVDVLPGSSDLFFRRFMMGAQLSALLLAGTGAGWCLRKLGDALDRLAAAQDSLWPTAPLRSSFTRKLILCGAGTLALSPALLQLRAFDLHNASAIETQQHADTTQGTQVDKLIAVIKRHAAGRVYAGMPSNWGLGFTVGAISVFKYLEARDVDEVGYTLRTASLMTDPEYYFDEHNASDYALFGIHYLILPAGFAPPTTARLTVCEGVYCLWTVATTGYVHIGRVVGVVTANRTNIGVRSIPILRSRLAQDGDYLRVVFGQVDDVARPLPSVVAEPAVGRVISERDSLEQGEVSAIVSMRRPGVAVLSASFDPGWQVTVDGRELRTEMVAPALVAVHLTPGTHRIAFRYIGFADYAPLFGLCGVSLIALLVVDGMRRRRRKGGGPAASSIGASTDA